MQLDGCDVVADGLDRFGKRHRPLVDGGTTGLLHGQGQVGGGDGTEQRTRLGGAGRNLDGEFLDLGAELLRVLDATDLTGVAGSFDALGAMSRPQTYPAADDETVTAGAPSPATKTARHGLIAQILGKERIRSQAELRRALADRGVSTTQATLSRDLVELPH